MYRVLIVEDDPMVAMINEQYVKKQTVHCCWHLQRRCCSIRLFKQ